MQLRNRFYSYPILINENGDYVDSLFNSKVTQSLDGYNMILHFSVVLKNQTLEKLLSEGYIEFVHHIECPQTCYRRIKETSLYDDELIIKNDEVNGKMQVCTFLVVKKDIKNYENNLFSEEIKGFKFDFDKGLIIGVAQQYDLQINKIKDDFNNTSSIIVVVPNLDPTEINVKVNLNNEKIVVSLPENMFNKYAKTAANNEIQPIIHSMLFIPALTYALNEIKYSDDSSPLRLYRWFLNIEKACKNVGVSLEEEDLDELNPLEVSQKLINSPLDKAFDLIIDGGFYNED